MAYVATTWTNGTTPVNGTNMNHLETQYQQAVLSYNQDFFSNGFVETGLVATKDGSINNQLDVTAGVAYLLQSVDSTFLRVSPSSSTQTTSAISSTYYLYLQPAGTWYWSTTNAPAANSLAIAQVTTDASGNILTVTDERVFNTTILPAAVGMFGVPRIVASALNVHVTATTLQTILTFTPGATGLYRVSMAISMGNSLAEKVLAQVSWTDPNLGTPTAFFTHTTINRDTPEQLGGSTMAQTVGPTQTLSLVPNVFYAKSAAAITVQYQDLAGSPSDFVTAVIERLA